MRKIFITMVILMFVLLAACSSVPVGARDVYCAEKGMTWSGENAGRFGCMLWVEDADYYKSLSDRRCACENETRVGKC